MPLISAEEEEVIAAAILGISSIPGVGFKTIQRLYDGGVLDNWAKEKDAFYLSTEIDKALQLGKRAPASLSRGQIEKVKDNGSNQLEEIRRRRAILITDRHPDFPSRLKILSKPPRWLFVEGNTGLLSSPSMISIVGTRRPSDAGLRLAYETARVLTSKEIVVLSGLAKGIDTEAHLGSVDAYGQTVAVLGHGMYLDQTSGQVELRRHIRALGGATVSEYLPTDPPSSYTFLRRNELVAALARIVIPIECPDLNSGTGATIRRAERVGTPVIGIRSKRLESESLNRTISNIESLGHQTFTVHNGDTARLWAYIDKTIPEHDWEGIGIRQSSFLSQIESRILNANRRAGLNLTESDIRNMALSIIDKLQKANDQGPDH